MTHIPHDWPNTFGIWDYQHDSEWRRLKSADVAQGKRVAELLAENDALRSELSALRSLPLVPVTLDRLERALGEIDALTRTLADIRDSRPARLAEERLLLLQRLAACSGRGTYGQGEEAFADLFAHVAEYGEVPGWLKEMRDAYERREEERRR